MEKKRIAPEPCLRPMPMALVSCKDINGEENALAVGYCTNCSFDPPMIMVGIVPSRYSYHMIKNSGVFVVNVTDKSNKELFDYMGSHSRRDVDKLKEFGANTTKGTVVDAPLLTDCPINIECEVVDSIVTGSHEMFVGKIVNVNANENVIDKDGKIDYSSIDFL